MSLLAKRSARRSTKSRLAEAALPLMEQIERRILMSTITQWNFNGLTAGTNLSPAPSSGAGTASSVGMSAGPTVLLGTQTSGNFSLSITDSSGGPYPVNNIPYNVSAATLQSDLANANPGGSTSTITVNANTTKGFNIVFNMDTGASITGSGANLHTPTNFEVQTAPPYPAANATGPDVTNILGAPTGSGNEGSSDPDQGADADIWRIQGNNGYNSSAPLASQGAQFLVSTSNYTGISVQFDLYATTQGEGQVQVQYTTDGSNWINVPAADLSTNGDGGITIFTGNGGTTTAGGYFKISGGQGWYNQLSANLSAVTTAVENDPSFGIRVVNAATGTGNVLNASGNAINNTSGNWRFDMVTFSGTSTIAAPSITLNPSNVMTTAGATVTFNAAANANPPATVQWYEGTFPSGTLISNGTTAGGTTYSGNTTDTLTVQTSLSAADNNDTYYAVFTNSQGGNHTTAATLNDPLALPSITSSPSSEIVLAGNNANFVAAATGSPAPTVQWYSSPDDGANNDWQMVGGATSPTLSFVTTPSNDGTYYEAKFSNSQGNRTTNSIALLTVDGAKQTAWNFDNDTIGTDLTPAPSLGTGSASSVGMSDNSTPGDMSPYPVPTGDAVGPDVSDILAGTGANGGSSDGSTGNIWRIRGANGWNSAAPIGCQGAQFETSTTGLNDIGVQFDLYTTTQGEGEAQVQYTTDSEDATPVWSNVPASDLSVNGDTGIAVANNPSVANGGSGNTTVGGYFSVTGGQGWYNALGVDLSGIPGVENNPNFGIRIVNASTGPDVNNASGPGNPLNNTSGNWRFDEVQIGGATPPSWEDPSSVSKWNPGTSTLSVKGPATIIADPGTDEPNLVVTQDSFGDPALLTIAPTVGGTAIHIGGLTLDPGGSIDMPSVEGAGMDGINGVERAQGANNVLVLGSVSAVTAESVNDNVVTLTANNDFQVGQMVDVGGTTATPGETDNAYDGTFPITAATPTSFSYDATGPNLSTISVAGGTLPAGASASTQASDPTFSIDNTQAVTAPITSATWSGTTVTIQATGNYTVGQMVTIAGVSTSGQIFSSDFSGGHQITGIVSGGFTFTSQNAPASGSSGTADLDDATVSRISNLNLEDNDMIFHGGNNDPAFDGYATDSSLFSGVQTAATIGRNGTNGSGGGFLDGTWDGNGLTSSAAANEAAYQGQEYTALGVVLNAELPTPFTSWDVGNEPMRYDGNDAIVKYTYVGDWTLQGTVNDNDYNIMVSNLNYSNAIPDWANGSYNGGAVDDNAYNVFLSALNNGITNGDPL